MNFELVEIKNYCNNYSDCVPDFEGCMPQDDYCNPDDSNED